MLVIAVRSFVLMFAYFSTFLSFYNMFINLVIEARGSNRSASWFFLSNTHEETPFSSIRLFYFNFGMNLINNYSTSARWI